MPQIAKLLGLGWKVKLQERKRNTFFSLAKEVRRGTLLSQGDSVYYYLIDIEGRKGLLVLLDKKPLNKTDDVVIK